MKCLSLHQPWASLLVTGAKRVETRSWPIRHRGPLLIHAAKKWNAELLELLRSEPFRFWWELLVDDNLPVGCSVPLGCVVGRVDVVACYPTEEVEVGSESLDPLGCIKRPAQSISIGAFAEAGSRRLHVTPTEKAFGDYSPNRYAWLCSDPVPFQSPIPFVGRQGFFDVPDDLIKE